MKSHPILSIGLPSNTRCRLLPPRATGCHTSTSHHFRRPHYHPRRTHSDSQTHQTSKHPTSPKHRNLPNTTQATPPKDSLSNYHCPTPTFPILTLNSHHTPSPSSVQNWHTQMLQPPPPTPHRATPTMVSNSTCIYQEPSNITNQTNTQNKSISNLPTRQTLWRSKIPLTRRIQPLCQARHSKIRLTRQSQPHTCPPPAHPPKNQTHTKPATY